MIAEDRPNTKDAQNDQGSFQSLLVAYRLWPLVIVHALLFACAYHVAYLLRFEFQIPVRWENTFWSTLPWVLAIKLGLFAATGEFHGWWRHITFRDVVALARICVFGLMSVAVVNLFLLSGGERIPRSIIVLDGVLSLIVIGAARSTWRLFREYIWATVNSRQYRPAILVGTDHESVVLAHHAQSYGHSPYRVMGLLNTNGNRNRGKVGQLPILGHVDELPAIVKKHGMMDVLATAGHLPGERLRKLMDICHRCGVPLKIIPRLEDRIHGDQFVPLRDIKIDDLLRRAPVELDTAAISELIEGRTVMVTGGGGSIGSEICRQLVKFNPRALVLLGRGENRIFKIHSELKAAVSPVELYPAIGDICDGARMRQVFEEFRPQVVFHAAAHKHVPLMELNAGEAVKNNLFGTQRLADVANEYGVERFVLISSDKAVRPTSVMGATKQLAERYVQALSEQSDTRFMAVRFGNVLGSANSVVPIFQQQIRTGGPITITDPRMKRYFMTIPEASQLVLQAAAIGRGGEVFLLEMGEPVTITDLAHDLIRLSGLPKNAIEINFTGIRPGEKLFEELFFDSEQTLETSHAKVRTVFQSPYSLSEVMADLERLRALSNESSDVLRAQLRETVRDYVPDPLATASEKDAPHHAGRS